MGLKDKSGSNTSSDMAGSWPGTAVTIPGEVSPTSTASTLSVNVNIKRNPSLKKLLKLPIFGGSGNGGGKFYIGLSFVLMVFYLHVPVEISIFTS